MNETKRKGLTKTEVITIVVAVLVIAILLALLVPALCKAGKMEQQFKDYQEQTNKELADLTAKLEGGLTTAEVEKLLSDTLANLDDSLSEDEVKAIVDSIIAGIEIPDELTSEQIKEIVDSAIAGIKIPSGLTSAQVKDIVNSAIAGIKIPAGLTSDQVKEIITNALKDIDSGLSKEDIEEIISGILANQPSDPTPFDLKAALEAGGNYALTSNVSLSDVNISKDVVSVLDLKGYTLTVGDEWEVLGSLTVVNGTIIIEKPDDEYAQNFESGIVVGNEEAPVGELKLDNVKVIGRRLWNVENNGTLQLTNSKYIVDGGYGLANSGAAEVEGCTMIANGDGVTQIYSTAGTVNVTNTRFSEGVDFVSYNYHTPIENHYTSKLTMEDVKVTVTPGEMIYSVLSTNGGTLVIKSAVLNEVIGCGATGSTVYVYGGTFSDGTKSVSYADITADSVFFEGYKCKLTQGENCWIISK